nr:MAG TPA: Putative golgin subfamily A member 2-like protein 5 [Caudoviricetes sp.]
MHSLAIPCVPFLLRPRLTLSNIIQPVQLIVKKLARAVGYLCST